MESEKESPSGPHREERIRVYVYSKFITALVTVSFSHTAARGWLTFHTSFFRGGGCFPKGEEDRPGEGGMESV